MATGQDGQKGKRMTEAMSRHEIEDVLTSIRRLVSQDPQDKQPRQARAAAAQVEKLVLTSALRIDDGADRSPQPETPLQNTTPADAGVIERQTPAAASLLSRIQSAGAAREAEPASRSEPDAEPVHASDDLLDADGLPASDDVLQPADTGTPAPQETVEDAALEATLSRLEAMLAAAPTANQSAVSSGPLGLETEVQTDAASEQVIDERMLYQLVAQIVRQELQGELGEKITRSIRKLVRSEVARELALRKL